MSVSKDNLISLAAIPKAKTENAGRLVSFARHPKAIIGLSIFAVVILAGLLAPIIRPGDPLSIVGQPGLWPGDAAAFPLGTDTLGRDVLAGVIHGARVSLTVGVVATLISLTFGSLIGAIAGYFGGRIDDFIVRFIEIFQTIPGFVLLVVLVAFVEPSVTTAIIGIGLVSWDTVARLTRAEFRSIRKRDFVLAAEASGLRHRDIILKEILPNALPPLVVTASIMVASAILMEAALSFMGLGDPNVVTWGSMIGSGRESLRVLWFLTAIPGLAIVVTVLALNLIGDALNDVLNPKQRRQRANIDIGQ